MAAGVGRVLIGGKDAGAGVALGRRTVVTAGHVLGRQANHPVGYQAADGTVIPVDAEPEADESLDAAALRLAEDLDGWLPVAAAVEGADWVVDSPPPGNDPTLTGTISKVGFRMENTRGVALDMLQLRVDQVPQRPSKPVQFPDDQGVARGAAGPGPARGWGGRCGRRWPSR